MEHEAVLSSRCHGGVRAEEERMKPELGAGLPRCRRIGAALLVHREPGRLRAATDHARAGPGYAGPQPRDGDR